MQTPNIPSSTDARTARPRRTLIARSWVNHSATTVGYIGDDFDFVALADCSLGPGYSDECEPFADRVVRACNSHDELLAELQNIASAKRFSREHFADDSAFCDWAQSRARAAIARAAIAATGGAA